ncbi:hypothetical protein SSX86_007805 [Deinandra increscens subsp. villosa]|uniref:RRM domain-containing protein n=1 Tax=Deinandra increscens subsp. villosa TaxID=3103831 RepID=A0AAP0DE45_9ASTR
MERERSWNVVDRRSRKTNGKEARSNTVVGQTSYYVTNIPEGCSKEDLEVECRIFGRVEDVFISRKRNKAGDRFWFIKFSGVKDRRELEKVLNRVRIGNMKISVNLERFNRDGSPVDANVKTKSDIPAGKPGLSVLSEVSAPVKVMHKSFAAAVVNDGSVGRSLPRVLELGHMVTKIYGIWVGCALLGRTSDLTHLCNLDKFPGNDDFVKFKIRYLGGLHIMLTNACPVEASEFLEDVGSWRSWFSKLDM